MNRRAIANALSGAGTRLGIWPDAMPTGISGLSVVPMISLIAVVAQSGAVQTAVLDWATSKGIGFSKKSI